MELYQCRVTIRYKKPSFEKYYDVEEKITNVRETKKMYICTEGCFIDYGTHLSKDYVDTIHNRVYSSLSIDRNKGINAIIEYYNNKRQGMLKELDDNKRIIEMLENSKNENQNDR